ncbi:interferon alpha/beta receptor 1a-like [Polymixia lowei]
MDAVDMRYCLRWDWNYTHDNYVTFTTQSTFLGIQDVYTMRCKNVSKTWCDLSAYLDYDGSYILQVRAERGGEWSNWTSLDFCASETAPLSAPSQLRVEPGNATVTVSFKEPMADDDTLITDQLGPLTFRLRYWMENTPDQRHEKDLRRTVHTVALEPHTRYCLQVRALSEVHSKESPYTQPQCVTTLGDTLMWPMVTGLMGLVVVVAASVYMCHRKWKKLFPDYTTPSSIVEPPISRPLLEPREISCVVSAVVVMDQTSGQEEDVILEVCGEEDISSGQDSGNYSEHSRMTQLPTGHTSRQAASGQEEDILMEVCRDEDSISSQDSGNYLEDLEEDSGMTGLPTGHTGQTGHQLMVPESPGFVCG